MTSRPQTLVLALAVPVIALVAVIGTRVLEGPSESTVAPAGANAVTIKDFAFTPDDLSVAKGATLEVTNADGATHTLTARNGSFDTGDVNGGSSAAVVLKTAGTFEYYCEIHDYMTGTVVVK